MSSLHRMTHQCVVYFFKQQAPFLVRSVSKAPVSQIDTSFLFCDSRDRPSTAQSPTRLARISLIHSAAIRTRTVVHTCRTRGHTVGRFLYTAHGPVTDTVRNVPRRTESRLYTQRYPTRSQQGTFWYSRLKLCAQRLFAALYQHL